MPTIIQFTLRRLRKAKGWTLEQLAEKAKIHKQTIWRLETGDRPMIHESTLQKLADALGVGPTVLTGQTPVPEMEDEAWPSDHAKLKFRISTAAYNAIYLVAERYDVTQKEIVELAPFLFCWAAEASLRKRRERLDQALRAYQNALHYEREIRHLQGAASPPNDAFAAESNSIDRRDLFGLMLNEGGFGPFNQDTDNPFAIFLDSLAEEMEGVATFDHYGWRDFAFYQVCPAEAAKLADGDAELAERILEGDVALHEMPKGIKRGQERAGWLQSKLAEYRHQLQLWAFEQVQADKSSS